MEVGSMATVKREGREKTLKEETLKLGLKFACDDIPNVE